MQYRDHFTLRCWFSFENIGVRLISVSLEIFLVVVMYRKPTCWNRALYCLLDFEDNVHQLLPGFCQNASPSPQCHYQSTSNSIDHTKCDASDSFDVSIGDRWPSKPQRARQALSHVGCFSITKTRNRQYHDCNLVWTHGDSASETSHDPNSIDYQLVNDRLLQNGIVGVFSCYIPELTTKRPPDCSDCLYCYTISTMQPRPNYPAAHPIRDWHDTKARISLDR